MYQNLENAVKEQLEEHLQHQMLLLGMNDLKSRISFSTVKNRKARSNEIKSKWKKANIMVETMKEKKENQ